MVNRVFFRVEYWKDGAVWLPVPYQAESHSWDEAVEAADLVDNEANYGLLRIVKVTEEIVHA